MSNLITVKEYFAVEGSRFSNKDARVVGPILEAMSGDGILSARQVLEAAKSPVSPLHEYFEWDDSVAADLWRRDQARQMLRSIQVKYADDKGVHVAKAFHVQRISETGSSREPRAFRSFQVLHGESAFAAQMMQSAVEDLQSWRRKYEPYVPIWENFSKTFAAVINQIDECAAEIVHPNLPAFTDDAVAELISWRQKFIEAQLTWDAWLDQMKYLIEAINEAELTFCQTSTFKHRDCVKCGKSFISVDEGNRMCRKCVNTKRVADQSSINAAMG